MQPPGLLCLLAMINFHFWEWTVPAIVAKLDKTTYGPTLVTTACWLAENVYPIVWLILGAGLLNLYIAGSFFADGDPSQPRPCFEDAIEAFTESILACCPPPPPNSWVGLDLTPRKFHTVRLSTRPGPPKSRLGHGKTRAEASDHLEEDDDDLITYDPFTFPYTYDPSLPLPPISSPPGFPFLTRDVSLEKWFPSVDSDAPRPKMPVWTGEGVDKTLDNFVPKPPVAPTAPKRGDEIEPSKIEPVQLDGDDFVEESDDSDDSDDESDEANDADSEGADAELEESDEDDSDVDTDGSDTDVETEEDDTEVDLDEDTEVETVKNDTDVETVKESPVRSVDEASASELIEDAQPSKVQVNVDSKTSLSATETSESHDDSLEPLSMPLKRSATTRSPFSPRHKKSRGVVLGIGSLRDKRGIEAVPRDDSDIDDYLDKSDIMYPFYPRLCARNADSDVNDDARQPVYRRKKRFHTLERSRPALKRPRTRTYRNASEDSEDDASDDEGVCVSAAPQRLSHARLLSLLPRLKTHLAFLVAARRRLNGRINSILYGVPTSAAPAEVDSEYSEAAQKADAPEADDSSCAPSDDVKPLCLIPPASAFDFQVPASFESELNSCAHDEPVLLEKTDSFESTIDSSAEDEIAAAGQAESPGLDCSFDDGAEDEAGPPAIVVPHCTDSTLADGVEQEVIAVESTSGESTSTTPQPMSWALVLYRRRPAKRPSATQPAAVNSPKQAGRRSRGNKRARTTFPDVAGVRAKRPLGEVSPEAEDQHREAGKRRSKSSKTKDHRDATAARPQTLEGGRPAQKRARSDGPAVAADATEDQLDYTMIRTSPRPLPLPLPLPLRRPASSIPQSRHKRFSAASTPSSAARTSLSASGYRHHGERQERSLVEVVEARMVHKVGLDTDDLIIKTTYEVLVERWVTQEESAALVAQGKLAWQVFALDKQAMRGSDRDTTPESRAPDASTPTPDSPATTTSPVAGTLVNAEEQIATAEGVASSASAPSADIVNPSTAQVSPTSFAFAPPPAELADLSFEFSPVDTSFSTRTTAFAATSSRAAPRRAVFRRRRGITITFRRSLDDRLPRRDEFTQRC